jgi:hypothetical protein
VCVDLSRVPVTVTTIYRDEAEVEVAKGGENLRLRLAGIDEEEVSSGFIVCDRKAPVPAVTYFNAQLQVRACVCPSVYLPVGLSAWSSQGARAHAQLRACVPWFHGSPVRPPVWRSPKALPPAVACRCPAGFGHGLGCRV